MPTTPEIKQMKRFANHLVLFSCFSFIFCGSAFAQVSESDIGSETGLNESISRLTSTFEVKRAVIGLLIIAAITVVLFFFYWYKTAQMAKENYVRDLQLTLNSTSVVKQQDDKSSWDVSKSNIKRKNKPFRKLHKY